jgi:hypothetical protein
VLSLVTEPLMEVMAVFSGLFSVLGPDMGFVE